jgi:hypothetical protein
MTVMSRSRRRSGGTRCAGAPPHVGPGVLPRQGVDALGRSGTSAGPGARPRRIPSSRPGRFAPEPKNTVRRCPGTAGTRAPGLFRLLRMVRSCTLAVSLVSSPLGLPRARSRPPGPWSPPPSACPRPPPPPRPRGPSASIFLPGYNICTPGGARPPGYPFCINYSTKN